MTELTKPHCKLSARAHSIAKHSADAIVTDADGVFWRTIYRNVYAAAFNEGEGVPLWVTLALISLAIAAGYAAGKWQ